MAACLQRLGNSGRFFLSVFIVLMSALDVSPLADRFQFGSAVRSRSWDWLFALRKRLNVEVQLVDDAQAPLLTAPGGSEAVDSLLSGHEPGVRLAISTAIRTRTPQAAGANRLQTVVVPVMLDRIVSGALVVARPVPVDDPAVRGQLELIGFWLTNAIEAHLQSPPAAQGDLDRLSALCQLLDDVSARRSDRDMVGTFIETLAVWHDLEGYGYVDAVNGFVRDVALPGADTTQSPAVIAHAALPELDTITRLARSDVERLGFAGGGDVALARVGEGEDAWLIAIAGPIESDEVQRLSLYVSLLDQAVARATQTAAAEVLAALSRQLLADSGNPEEQARQAIREVQAALGLTSAAFTVTSRTGSALLHVGSTFTAADLAAGSGAGKVVIIRRDPQQYAMAFVADWSPDHHVTPQEGHVTRVVADLLESWVRQLVRQSPRIGDRRATRRGFDEVLERFAQDAVQSGIPVTAVVLSFGDAAFSPDVTQARVASLREHVRGGDLVGRLGEGDVGVLLHDAVATQAEAVVRRMRQLLERDIIKEHGQVAIGMATRRPGDPTTGALAQEARQRARYHASDN
jgi:GGDEF domain-containing protein